MRRDLPILLMEEKQAKSKQSKASQRRTKEGKPRPPTPERS